MPEPITVGIRAHHRVDLAPDVHRWSAAIVHLADYIVSCEGIGDLQEGSALCFSDSVLALLGITPEALPAIIEETRADARKAASVLANP
jgi:hypothetical protein